MNQVVELIVQENKGLQEKKRGLKSENENQSPEVHSKGIEPISSESESDILSIELRVRVLQN